MDSNAAAVPPLPVQPKSRKKFWTILILSILLFIFVLIGGCCTLVYVGYKGLGKILRSSEVYAMSMQRAQASPCVVSKLGQPIENKDMPQGSVNENNGTGTADLTIPVTGPQGKGSLHAIGSRDNNVWTLTSVTLNINGTDYDLPAEPGPCQ